MAMLHARRATLNLAGAGLLLALLACGGGVGSVNGSANSGTFSATGAMVAHRFGPTATLLPSGQVLVAGGSSSLAYLGNLGAAAALASAERYDPTAGTFAATGSMGVARVGHTATLLASGLVLVAGGSASTRAELYDPATGTFADTGAQVAARFFPAATLLASGKVLLTGGTDNSGTPLASAELYDPAAGTFAVTASLAAARAGHTATLLADGTVLVAGGLTGSGYLASAERYEPVAGTFNAVGSLAQNRALAAAVATGDGKVLVAGGIGTVSGGAVPLTTLESYDPTSQVFATVGALPTGTAALTATLLDSGKVLLAGGLQSGGSGTVYSATAKVFTPATGTLGAAGSMHQGRIAHAAALLDDGRVLVAGGTTQSPDAEVYQP